MRVLYHTGCWSAKCGLSRRMLNVCIIGSGVAGLSTARRLIKVKRVTNEKIFLKTLILDFSETSRC